MKNYRAVIFDMDGTMFDTERRYFEVWRAALAALGLELELRYYAANFLGRSTADCEKMLAERFGARFVREQFAGDWPARWKTMADREGIPEKAGLRQLLDHLSASKVTLAVASSSNRREIEDCLSRTGLIARFSSIVSGEEVRHSKPAPDIFLRAAEKLGIAPAHALVLEDSAPGIKAARAGGFDCVLIPDLHAPAAEVAALATKVLPTLADVCELFPA